MVAIKLKDHQIIRKGKFPAPNIQGYDSLFFHPLTSQNSTEKNEEWGYQLTIYCTKNDIDFYFFYNDNMKKINVYPNEAIEELSNLHNNLP